MSIYNIIYVKYYNEANVYASQYGIDPSTAHNGAWDAFRHAYASGAMILEYGETAARIFGYLNGIKGEILLPNKPAVKRRSISWMALSRSGVILMQSDGKIILIKFSANLNERF